MKKLVFIMTGCCGTDGGIANLNANILQALVRLAKEKNAPFSVFSFLECEKARPALPTNVEFRGFKGHKQSFSIALLCRAFTSSLFIFDHVTLALPMLPAIGLKICRPIIFAHGSESWRKIRRTSVLLFKSSKLCITNSEFTLRKMKTRIGQFNGVACPLGLPVQVPLNQGLPLSPPTPLQLISSLGKYDKIRDQMLLLVGRMHPKERAKGHEELLKVWPKIVRVFPKAQLVFVGPGEDRPRLENIAVDQNVGDSVFFTGKVDSLMLQQLYASCYAFVMPSNQEGFGLVYLEAMNFAKPCLGCFDDGAEDVILHEKTGLLIRDKNNNDELFHALARLLSNQKESRRMGERGFERLHQNFTSTHVQHRIYHHISTVFTE